MAHDRIPIHATHAEAREQLEKMHQVGYRDSILGATVRATCTCGWRSPWLTQGWVAQEVAGRHLTTYVEHPLENRARYAIFWKVCMACNGSGRFETRDAIDQGECAHCYEGGLWTILDRTDEDLERYAKTQDDAIQRLWSDLSWEAGR